MWDARPIAAECDDERLYVTLSDGRVIGAPLWWYPRLLNADPLSRDQIQLMPLGVSWPALDEDISIDSLLAGEKAPGAINPAEKPQDIQSYLASIRFLPPDWETREEYLVNGANSAIDYRTLIHRRIERGRDSCIPRPEIDYKAFFASTDTLLDVQNLLYVAEFGPWPQLQSVGQLWMYGALQALAVQQDAVLHLLECFKFTTYPNSAQVYAEVRDLRISAVGHPHNHSNKQLVYRGSSFLGEREHGSRTRFKVCTYAENKQFVMRTVDVPELIAKQQMAVQIDLSQVWNAIKSNPSYDSDLNQAESA